MGTTPHHVLHLIAWAQIGVVIRVYLGLLLGSACSPSQSWVPCVTSNGLRDGGAMFTDLPANILGSFLMGMFVSSDVLSNSLKHTLTVEAPLAMLPVWSPLQTHLPFQVGLRTGLCGSLTTFASWNLQMVLMMVGGYPMPLGSQWVEALAGLLVGCLCALAALVMGQHIALLIYHKLNPGAFIPYGSPAPEQLKLEGSTSPKDQQQAAGLQRLSSRLPTRTLSSVTHGSTTMVVVDAGTLGRLTAANGSITGTAAGLRPGGSATAAANGSLELTRPAAADGFHHSSYSSADGQQLSSTAALMDPFAAPQLQQQQSPRGASLNAQQGSTGLPAPHMHSSSLAEVITEVDEGSGVQTLPSVLLVDCFAGATVCLLTSISLWRIIGSSKGLFSDAGEPFAVEWIWWAILFGPVGCYLRYYLSRFNGALRGDWKWFPLGTFAANIGACGLDYVVRALEVRLVLGSLQLAVLNGIVSGVGGCLSTVSTWVVEIQRLLLSFPNTSHGYNYVFISLFTSVTLGLLLYGIPVWTLGA